MKNYTSKSVTEPSALMVDQRDSDNKVECRCYLGGWFEALKHSPHYTQMCRSGLFNSDASFRTYEMFGSVEDLTFEQWWLCKGVEKFGSGCIELANGLVISYQSSGFDLKVNLNLPINKHWRAIGFDGLALATSNKFRGLLSDNPVAWPFFKTKISPYAIGKSLQVVKACQTFAKTGKFKMWEIGEQLNLKRASTGQSCDWKIDLIDKHIDMGKLVSAENKRGMILALNASQGIFPSFANR